MKTTTIINFDIPGIHYDKAAPEEVAFLRNEHRHLFTIKAGFEVSPKFKKQDPITLQVRIYEQLRAWHGFPCNFVGRNCTEIASNILNNFEEKGMIWCEVLEDNKNGARVEF